MKKSLHILTIFAHPNLTINLVTHRDLPNYKRSIIFEKTEGGETRAISGASRGFVTHAWDFFFFFEWTRGVKENERVGLWLHQLTWCGLKGLVVGANWPTLSPNLPCLTDSWDQTRAKSGQHGKGNTNASQANQHSAVCSWSFTPHLPSPQNSKTRETRGHANTERFTSLCTDL